MFLYDVVLNFFQVGIVRELRREILDLLRRQGNKGEVVPRKSRHAPINLNSIFKLLNMPFLFLFPTVSELFFQLA